MHTLRLLTLWGAGTHRAVPAARGSEQEGNTEP